MPTLKKARNDKEELSEIISDRVRIISLAILGLNWTFIFANITSNSQNGAGLAPNGVLLIPTFFAILTLSLDFIQYLLGFNTTSKHITGLKNTIKNKSLDEDTYSEPYSQYAPKLHANQIRFFVAKIAKYRTKAWVNYEEKVS